MVLRFVALKQVYEETYRKKSQHFYIKLLKAELCVRHPAVASQMALQTYL